MQLKTYMINIRAYYKKMREKVWTRRDEDASVTWKRFLRQEMNARSDKRKVNVAQLSGFVISVARFIEYVILEGN